MTGACVRTTSVLMGLLVALLAADPGRAEHEVHYRYTVLGYVRDGAGKPRPGVLVEVVREKTGLIYRGMTDEHGFYVIVTRLGDESAGETLRVQVGDRRASIVARFNPEDHSRERGTRVDAAGERLLERSPAFAETLKRFLTQ
jgi:hypothetical protein